MRSLFGAFVAVFVLFLGIQPSAEAQGRPSLLNNRSAPIGADSGPPNTTKGLQRQREVTPDLGVLRQLSQSLAKDPATAIEIDLPLFEDLTFVARITRVERTKKGAVNYFGTIEGIPFSSVTLVLSHNLLSGNIQANGKAYQILGVGKGVYQVLEIDRSQLQDHPDAMPTPRPAPSKGMSAADAPTVQADDGSTIDLMVVYTPAARAGASPGNPSDPGPILSQIDLAVAATNLAYANSGVIQRLELVHAEEVAYTESHDMQIDLGRLTNANPANGIPIPPDGFMDNVQGLRDTFGADAVSLWVEDGGPGIAGLGWLMDTVGAGFAGYAYNVVRRDQASSNQTLAHELGHNMGLRHDNYMDNATTPFAWAHGYVDLTNRFRTVMSYNNQCADTPPYTFCTRIDAFSSPTHTYGGNATGNGATADAARVLNDTRLTVANFRASVPSTITLEFALPTYTVLEGGPAISATVTRSGPSTGAVSVTWTTANGTAVAGQEFGTLASGVQRTGTLSWASGDTTAKTITIGPASLVPILNDTTIEPDKSFTIVLSAPTGGAVLGANDTATITVADDDSVFSFDSATASLSEAGPNIVLTVTRTGSLATTATVTYTTSNGTAIAGTDFGSSGFTAQITGVLSFGPGVFQRLITVGPTTVAAPYIRVINDTTVEGSKIFNVALSAPTGGGQLGAITTAAVTIDSDDGGFTLAGSTLSLAESVGATQLQVNRTGPTAGAVSVNYAFTNGTALNGTHYTGVNGTLNWADGDGAAKFIPVTIIDNAAVNSNRTFTVALNTPVGASVGTPGSTTVTITDDDNTLQFNPVTYTVSEGLASVNLTVTRLGGTAGAASVNWTTANATAASGSDFGVLGNPADVGGTLNWGAGDAAAKTITIPILADVLIEGNETFTVTLSGAAGTGTSLGAATVATVTITDNDSGVTFAQPSYDVIESGPMISVLVNRIGTTTNAIGVTWTTSNGTATAGSDFGTMGNPAQRTGTLSWAAGDATAKTITVGPGVTLVPIINDTAFEPTENFTITLSAPTGGAALGPTPSTNINIIDDESAFAFAAPTLNVSEGGPNVTLNVTRTGSLATVATVRYTTANGTATVGSDFGTNASTIQPTGVISFGVGESLKTITIGPAAAAAPYIPIINDTVIEGPETFTITLSAPTGGGQLGAPAVATVTIDSNDTGIAMGAATRSVAENAGSIDLQVVRVGPAVGAISVNYAFTNGTATNPAHYSVANGTLNWADGDAAPKNVHVVINDDALVNANRTFTMTLSGAVGATIGSPTNTVVTIVDDDNTVQFSAPTASVTEGTASISLTVTRVGGAANPAFVTWTTADGSALAGSDFGTLGNTTALTGTLNWIAGESASKTIMIPIINDAIVEGAKTFTVNLSAPAGATIGANPTSTVTINDNDAGVVFAQATYSIAENGGNVTLTVNRIGPSTAAASVNWATVNGTAVAGADFGTLGNPAQRTGTLSWLAGNATPKTIVIPILNDVISEADKAFTVVLSAPSAGIVLGTPSTATVNVLDDDIPPETALAFSLPKYLVLENAGSVTLTVNRIDIGGGFGRAVSVSYATQAGTALATSDYTTTNGTLNWAGGDSAAKTIIVPIVNDATPESPEQFKVLLSGVTPGTGIATPEATVLIVDDDEAFPLDGAFPANWTTPGPATAGWIVSNEPGAYEGVFSLRSETIGDGETSQVQVAGTFVAGTVSFRLKISSELNFDFLRFYIDGVPAPGSGWSGTTNTAWQLYSTTLSAGFHTLTWSYEKDGSASLGSDAAWIDAVTMPAYTP